MTVLPTLVSTALFFTSALPAAPATASAQPQFAFTQVLPDSNFVAYKALHPELQTIPTEEKTQIEPTMPIVQATAVQLSNKPTVTPVPTMPTQGTPAPTSAPTGPTTYEEVYKQAGEKYGVPWQVLYGIHMTETGGRNGAISSGHGPQGPMQFMPGTFQAYAVDGNGDGATDINDATDAIYTAANYMAKHGSLESGLRSYGGNTAGTLRYAQEKGFNQ